MYAEKFELIIVSLFVIFASAARCQGTAEDTSWIEKYRTYDSRYNPSSYSQLAAAGGLYCQVEKFNREIANSMFPSLDMEFLKEYGNQYSNLHINKLRDINNLVKNFDAIVINEAHDNPLTRLAASEMLDSFRKWGYELLFMEALYLDPPRAEINNKLGLYFRDPVLVDQYRRAQILGYRILSYDTLLSNAIIRDSLQAERIISKLAPNQKFVILCGYDHGSKSDHNTGSMLNVLRRRTNLKILNFDAYKYSFTGMIMEKTIAKVLSPKIEDPDWFAFVKGDDLEAIGLTKTGYDYHIVYRASPCFNVRSFVLHNRSDLKILNASYRSDGMISVYAYENRRAKSSFLFDRLFVSKGRNVDIGIPKRLKYFIKYEPVENLFKQ